MTTPTTAPGALGEGVRVVSTVVQIGDIVLDLNRAADRDEARRLQAQMQANIAGLRRQAAEGDQQANIALQELSLIYQDTVRRITAAQAAVPVSSTPPAPAASPWAWVAGGVFGLVAVTALVLVLRPRAPEQQLPPPPAPPRRGR